MQENPGEKSSKQRSRMLRLALAVAALIAMVGVIAWNSLSRQNLRVSNGPGGVLIDVRWLGEYQANVSRFRVVDVDAGSVVWEIRAQHGYFPLERLELGIGENPSLPAGLAGCEAVVPAAPSFQLLEAKAYRAEMWCSQAGLNRHEQQDFVLRRSR